MIVLILILILLVSFMVHFMLKKYSYWDNYDIPSLKANIPFGNLLPVVKKEHSFGTAFLDIYKSSKDRILGIYLFFKPALLIRDPILIKNILTTDFEYFHDRGLYNNPEEDPMSSNLFSMDGKEWKNLRTRLTPAFSSGKLRGMFDNIKSIGDHLIEHLQTYTEKNTEIDIRDIASRYAFDCLASIAFGLENVSCIDNPNYEYRNIVKRVFEGSEIMNVFRQIAYMLCPSLLKTLSIKTMPEFMSKILLEMVTDVIEHREANHTIKKDLMQYFIQLRNNGDAHIDDWHFQTDAKSLKSLSTEEIASNTNVFYIAGTESSSSAIAYTLYELTQNDSLMERAKKDIRETLQKHNGEITYESIKDMQFIDLCVKETMRKYPGLPILNRICTKDYKVPDMNFTIEKGTSIIISILGLSRDEKYYKNPEKYSPDRFTEQHIDSNDMYIPFGLGPHNCIAYRMGLLIAKIAVVMLLKSFKFEALSIKELELDFKAIVLLPKEGECIAKISKEISKTDNIENSAA